MSRNVRAEQEGRKDLPTEGAEDGRREEEPQPQAPPTGRGVEAPPTPRDQGGGEAAAAHLALRGSSARRASGERWGRAPAAPRGRGGPVGACARPWHCNPSGGEGDGAYLPPQTTFLLRARIRPLFDLPLDPLGTVMRLSGTPTLGGFHGTRGLNSSR